MPRVTKRTYGVIYLIRCDQNGLHKIGITNNWAQRRRQLRVGETTTQVHVVRVNKAEQLERYLHRRFSEKRLPQSEWFSLDSEDLVFVRSVFLKARSDYKAGGHKSPEVAAPPPPPSANPPTPQGSPEPPTADQVKNSGAPKYWSDQQARASAHRHATQAARQAAKAAEPRSSGDAQTRAEGKESLITPKVRRYAYAGMALPLLLAGAGAISFLVEVGRSLKPAAPTEAAPPFTRPPLPENRDPVVPPQPQNQIQAQPQPETQPEQTDQPEQPKQPDQPEQAEETPQQAVERRRAEVNASLRARAAARRAELEQVRLKAERKAQAKFEKAQAYLRSQCTNPMEAHFDLRCAEAKRIVSTYRSMQYRRRKQEAVDYFNDPTSPVPPPPKATPPASSTPQPPLPSFTAP